MRHLTPAITVVEAQSDEDMASVRNDALDRATGDWVLMLDATQTLDPASVKRVRRLVDKRPVSWVTQPANFISTV